MRLYTKTGDDGTTGLVTGGRVGKDTPRVEACGAVDELNSAVGLANAACKHGEISTILRGVQRHLFDLGADLMTVADEKGHGGKDSTTPTRIGPDQVREVEVQIDGVCERLPALRKFILPGGCELAARLHVARTACRLAERRCVALERQEKINHDAVVYLNRLSDLLFALARLANQLEGVADVVWEG